MLADLAYATTIRPTRRSRTHMRRLTRIQHSVTNIATSAFDGPSATAELFFLFFLYGNAAVSTFAFDPVTILAVDTF